MRALADETEDALTRVDRIAHEDFGADESAWRPGEQREYLIRLDAARFDPEVVA